MALAMLQTLRESLQDLQFIKSLEETDFQFRNFAAKVSYFFYQKEQKV